MIVAYLTANLIERMNEVVTYTAFRQVIDPISKRLERKKLVKKTIFFMNAAPSFLNTLSSPHVHHSMPI